VPPAASRPAGLGPDETPPWSLARRVAFRFGFLYLLLYGIPSLLVDLPLLSLVGEAHQAVWAPLVEWLGGALLGIEVPARLPNGSGDQLFHYLEILCLAVVSGLGAIAWSLADRRRAHHRDLAELLRVYLRYLLAFIMITYGMLKVLKSQFPDPSPIRLLTPVGQMSPMGLLWTLMGHSTAYNLFTGLAEVMGGALLLSRRTTTLGALVLTGVLANVVALNYCFDVPVKLFSSHLLLMAVILLAPDARRLVDLLVRNRAAAPMALGAPPWPARWRRALPIVKGVVIAAMLAHVGWTSLDAYRTIGDGRERAPLEGVYRVIAAPAGPDAWQQVAIGAHSFAAITADGRVHRFGFRLLTEPGAFKIVSLEGARRTGWLTATERGGELHIAGEMAGQPISLRLRPIPDAEFLLLGRGYHWVNEGPFNR
jgi:uncharacterized membrane protein YphA (DoxX/SURF4 family)